MESLIDVIAGPPVVRWRDRDPALLTEFLVRNGFSIRGPQPDGTSVLPLGRVDVLIEGATRAADEGLRLGVGAGRTRETGALQSPPHVHPNGVTGVAAVGFATVDAERAIGDSPALGWQRAGEDGYLGARAWSARAGRMTVLLLEPATEGRLASALARMGEGPVALYLWRGGAAGAQLPGAGEAAPWPLGDGARPIAPRRSWGPFLLLVEAGRDATSAPREGARPAGAGRLPDAAG